MSARRRSARSERRAGFVLVEMMLAMAIIALLAALALPLVAPQRGSAALRAKTAEVAAILRTARNTALRLGDTVAVVLDGDARAIRSGGNVVGIPGSLAVEMRPARREGLLFFADGRANGGELALSSKAETHRVRVNPQTAAVDVIRR